MKILYLQNNYYSQIMCAYIIGLQMILWVRNMLPD